MKLLKKSSNIVLGMALFSMFFGSGNLIYPLFVGASSNNWIYSTFGFVLTGVLLPFIGVLVMVLFKGSYQDFFKILGKNLGFIFTMLILTIWIPLGSAPRCIALTYSSISSYCNIGPIWIFSLIYSFLVFIVISGKMGIINFLGKIITPILIGSILLVFFIGLAIYSPSRSINTNLDFSFCNALIEGYNTMDLIASFFFSASVIQILYQKSKGMSSSLKSMIQSSIIGMCLLAFVYIILIYTAAKYGAYLQDIPKDQLLVHLFKIILGSKFSVISLVAITLACFSTSVALVIAYGDFLQNEIFKNSIKAKFSIVLSIVISYFMSLFGLQGIAFVTAPILKICYPILLGLIVINVIKIFIKEKLEYKRNRIQNFENMD